MQRLDAGAAVACSLNDADFKARRSLARRTLIDRVAASERLPNALVLAFDETVPLEDLSLFVTLERECCPFLDFVIAEGAPTRLTISGPPEASATIDVFAAAVKQSDHETDQL